MNVTSSELGVTIGRTNLSRGSNRASGPVFDEFLESQIASDFRKGSRPYPESVTESIAMFNPTAYETSRHGGIGVLEIVNHQYAEYKAREHQTAPGTTWRQAEPARPRFRGPR